MDAQTVENRLYHLVAKGYLKVIMQDGKEYYRMTEKGKRFSRVLEKMTEIGEIDR